jgi:hypothetical protein
MKNYNLFYSTNTWVKTLFCHVKNIQTIFHSAPFHSIPFYFIPFHSILFHQSKHSLNVLFAARFLLKICWESIYKWVKNKIGLPKVKSSSGWNRASLIDFINFFCFKWSGNPLKINSHNCEILVRTGSRRPA